MSGKINSRVGEEAYNNQGCLMRIIEYNRYNDIVVEFQDEYKAHVHGNMERFKKGNIRNPNYRLGEVRINNQNYPMKVVKYKSATDMEIEFQDEFKAIVKTEWRLFDAGAIRNPNFGINIKKYNNKGYLMKCIEYNGFSDILIEFQDKYKAVVHTDWKNFENGTVRNPYAPSVCDIGIVGNKYPVHKDNKTTKEYNAWSAMINRSYNKKFKKKNQSYENVTCCKEWLLFENFYEWLHEQENFDEWYNNENWHLDKDIIIKGNKVYSPNTCCLVPIYINSIFTKNNVKRGNLPIGVSLKTGTNKYVTACYGVYKESDTPEETFQAYKNAKESYIKQIAQEEYSKGNITKRCYEAMMNYEVEITD